MRVDGAIVTHWYPLSFANISHVVLFIFLNTPLNALKRKPFFFSCRVSSVKTSTFNPPTTPWNKAKGPGSPQYLWCYIFRNCHCGTFTEGWVKSFTLVWWQWAQLHLCSEHGKVKGHTSVIYYQCELSPALYMGGGGCSRDILRRIGFAVNQSLAHGGFVAEQLYLLSLSLVHISQSLWLPPISFHSSLF